MHSPLLKKIYTKNPKGMGNLAKNDEIQSKFPLEHSRNPPPPPYPLQPPPSLPRPMQKNKKSAHPNQPLLLNRKTKKKKRQGVEELFTPRAKLQSSRYHGRPKSLVCNFGRVGVTR